jgi:hypothetical protein
MTVINSTKTKFENATPILSVSDLVVSVRYYVETLGFESADWGSNIFTSVNRDQAGIYLCQGGRGDQAHGFGLGWKMLQSSMKNTKRAAPGF